MLKPKRKSLIESAIENNKQPTRSRSTNDLLLPLGSKRYARLQQRGKTTPAGRFYFSQTKTGPETFDIQGTVVQRGSTEMLLTSGKARVLRRLVGSEYQYTHLGKKYFDAKKVQYLVHVPAIIKKAHSSSTGRRFMVPHNAFMNEELHVNAHASEAELKARVLNFMVQNLDKLHGRIVLYHDSDPVLYDEDGNWTFDVQTTIKTQSGNMKTQTTLDRPLGATPLLASHTLLPEGLCKEAFLDSKGNCVAVQLSALLKKPISRIENEIDRFFHALEDKSQYEVDGHVYSWREMGVTAKIIAQIGESNNMNTYILSGGRKIAQFKHNRTNNRACLCFTIESDHAWFYDNNQARLNIRHLDVHSPRPQPTRPWPTSSRARGGPDVGSV